MVRALWHQEGAPEGVWGVAGGEGFTEEEEEPRFHAEGPARAKQEDANKQGHPKGGWQCSARHQGMFVSVHRNPYAFASTRANALCARAQCVRAGSRHELHVEVEVTRFHGGSLSLCR